MPQISKKGVFGTLILPKRGVYSAVFGKRLYLHFVKNGRIWLNCQKTGFFGVHFSPVGVANHLPKNVTLWQII